MLISQFGCLNAKLYDLAICAIFKNEAPYLEEWIEYHKLVGVEHFYLYNNGSEDNFLDVLKPYIEAKEVTLVQWPNRSSNENTNVTWAWVMSTQVAAYEHAFSETKGKVKWIAAIDIDEFIVPAKEDTILKVLNKYEGEFPGVEVFWDMFGTAHQDMIPPNRLLIELLQRKSREDFGWHKVTKSILKPELYKGFSRPPHTCLYKGGKRSPSLSKEEIVINHYSNRCNSYFFVNKVKNKESMDNVKWSQEETALMLSLGNDEEDKRLLIQRFVPPLKKIMKERGSL